LNLTYDEALLNCAFDFHLRRYTAAADDLAALKTRVAEKEEAATCAAAAAAEQLAALKVGRCRLTPGWPQVDPRLAPGRPQVGPRLAQG